jgi:hypothetical protein
MPNGLLDLWEQGRPYREALGGLLNGDLAPAKDVFLKKEQLTPDQVKQQAYQMAMDWNNPMAAAGLLGHTVWHGSPHKFDKFDISKIGTGEGAQAYGHGLYFAEHPATAEVYASKLVNGGAIPMPPIPHDFMVDGARYVKQGGSLLKQVGDSADLIPVAKGEYGAALTKARDVYEAKSKAGNLYKTDIPDEILPRMLDWDKPLSQQAPEVQSFARSVGADLDKAYGGRGGDGQNLVKLLSAKYRSDDAASNALREAGIPGIRYLDSNSRGTGGTSNYVLFDDKLPRILEINGVPTGLLSYADEAKKVKRVK